MLELSAKPCTHNAHPILELPAEHWRLMLITLILFVGLPAEHWGLMLMMLILFRSWLLIIIAGRALALAADAHDAHPIFVPAEHWRLMLITRCTFSLNAAIAVHIKRSLCEAVRRSKQMVFKLCALPFLAWQNVESWRNPGGDIHVLQHKTSAEREHAPNLYALHA